mmetsp:Transcript_15999/g.26363  ORF Transcript_15999/g.26363 Transcript_15999/m.26363 type:complete len:131 (-) Transcript_15999:804-1196(-)
MKERRHDVHVWSRNDRAYKERFVDDAIVSLPVIGNRLRMKQDADTVNTIYDSAIVLAVFLTMLGPNLLQGKRMVEIGAGCGLVGITAALLGAEVILTEQGEMLKTLEANVSFNACRSAEVRELDWLVLCL